MKKKKKNLRCSQICQPISTRVLLIRLPWSLLWWHNRRLRCRHRHHRHKGQLEAWRELRHYGLEVLLVRLQHPRNLLMYKIRNCCLLGWGQAQYRSRTTNSSRTSTRCHACKLSSNPFQVTTTLAPHNNVYVILSHTGRGRLCRSRQSVLTSRLLGLRLLRGPNVNHFFL